MYQNQNYQNYQQPMQQDTDRELGWDDTINEDPKEFVTLTPGDYRFTVSEIERSRYDGGEKIPACNMAIVTCKFETPQGEAYIKNRLYLHTKTEGLISAFFSSIGLKRKGEPLRMEWNKVVGQSGVARVKNRVYNGQTYNDIDRFLLPDNYDAPAPQAPQAGGWSGGRY